MLPLMIYYLLVILMFHTLHQLEPMFPGIGVWTIGNLNDQANATLTITAIVNATGKFYQHSQQLAQLAGYSKS